MQLILIQLALLILSYHMFAMLLFQSNADPQLCRHVIDRDNYEAVHNLVLYYQMVSVHNLILYYQMLRVHNHNPVLYFQQGLMQNQIIASHTCFGGHMDVNC